MESVPENTMTVQQALQSVGKRVACKPGLRQAMLLKVTGTTCLIRLCDPSGAYLTVGVDSLVRREDWDGNPEPWWLTKARFSRRPAHDMQPALRPEAFTLEPNVIDLLTYASYKTQRSRGTEAERLRLIFDDVDLLEEHYQEELELARELDARVVRVEAR